MSPRMLMIGIVLLGACAVPDDELDTEDLGVPLTPAGDVRADGELAWSRDAAEIYYLSSPLAGPTSLSAAKTDGSGVRVIDDAKSEYWTIAVPQDRSSLYYTALENGRSARSLYEAFNPREISGLVLDNKADVIGAAPDNRHLAFWSGDRLQYFDTSDGSSVPLAEGSPRFTGTAGNHEVITFSPAGDQIFFLVSDRSAAYGADIINLASGNVESKTLYDGLWPVVSWDELGIRILWAVSNRGSVAYQVENVTTGTVDPLWQPPYDADISARNAWSPDGRKVAIWAGRCVEAGGSIDSCRKYIADLFVIETRAGTVSRIARTMGGPGTMAFAPSGNRIAYVTHQRVYVSDTP